MNFEEWYATTFGKPNILRVLGTIVVLLWIILIPIFLHQQVFFAYGTTNLNGALLIIDSIFLSAIFVIVASLYLLSVNNEVEPKTKDLLLKIRTMSIGVAILPIMNIMAYFTSGWLYSIAVFYQVLSPPALIFRFYTILRPEILLP